MARIENLGTNALRAKACRAILFSAIVAFSALSLLPAANAQQTERARRLGAKLMCICGCNQILTACNHVGCTYSHSMLKELDKRVARNEPDDLTLQDFVQEYGPTVLASPPAKGFDLWAWLMPVIAPLIGMAIVWMLVVRWRHKVALAGPAKISPELLARARREMGGDSDE